MESGKLRHRVTFQREIETPDDIGGQILEWVQIKTVWAAVDTVSSREQMNASKNRNEITHSVLIRYMQDLKITDRMLFNGRFFNIVSLVQPSKKIDGTKLMVLEGSQV